MGKTTLVNGLFTRLCRLSRRLGGNERGNVAMIFAFSLPVVAMMSLGGIDYQRASTARSNLQDALDAATLAAARAPTNDAATLNEVGLAALRANLTASRAGEFNDSDASFTLDANQVVVAEATLQVNTLIANVVLPPYGRVFDDHLPVTVQSEVNRASRNVEVALALDITGSMDNCTRNCPKTSKLEDLQAAAKELIDIVVQTNQAPFYSKVALAPYSMGVNVGSYANTVRGTLGSGTASISAATWLTGSVKTITGITRDYPAVVTASNHGFVKGDKVVIWSSERMTALNSGPFTVDDTSSNKFELKGINSSNYSSFSGEAYVAKCARSDCSVVMTASGHGLSTLGDVAHLTSMGGLAQLNDVTLRVNGVDGSTLTLAPPRASSLANAVKGGTTYTSGGKTACTADGCQTRMFVNADGGFSSFASSTCVSERAGSAAYSDAAPTSSSTRVGRNYPGPDNDCPSRGVVPLTSAKKTLTDEIDEFVAVGSTAGHIGLAWAWYLVSPTFGVWSGASAPAAYNTAETLKSVVLMTDGEFNTPYFRGVIASDAGTGSGATNTHINQPASNGSPFAQAFALCQAMKAKGVVVYTVGFDIPAAANLSGDIDSAGELMARCATSADRSFNAGTGADLKTAFQEIGRDITRLRISK
ncbi:pilus assembly protein TadG-related protein [Brevundimonas sp. PAMC22021]|uniref:TadE/TadG family type IV pilus assembly protein n=1 Tax=Brevundimonas sp. PAMC22021 TaxID=2861285 RepID=UPI001C62D40F|nr:pilus assembly protein TadG-related protein [Brevundimonas sp. PAMC22021]QYF86796.1 pilus assembly protein [Brevundimonas sp. PAMC22021]